MAAYRGYEKRGYNYYRRQVAAAATAAYGECEESTCLSSDSSPLRISPSFSLGPESEDHHLYVPVNPMTPRIISLHY